MRAGALCILLLLASAAAADHLLCLSPDGTFRPPAGCLEQTTLEPVPAAPHDRKFAFVKRSANQIILGILPAHQTAVDARAGPMIALGYALGSDAEGILSLKEATLGTWKLTLEAWWFQDEQRLNINVPPGTWEYVVTRDGRKLDERTGLRLTAARHDESRPGTSGRVTIRGRAVGADGTPADFAEITADCKRVVCTAAADGSFHCNTAVPLEGTFCVEHPRLGRKRAELQIRGGRADFGVIELVAGATIRVVRPLHVVLPDDANVALLQNKTELRESQTIATRDLVEFTGIKPGRYDVLLSGPEPLQRKLFPVEVTTASETEVVLALQPYRLTGDATWRKKPLAGATVSLDGDAWQTDVQTNQSGRFDVEMWAPGEYGVAVSSAELVQPYLVMKRVSPADAHWRLDVPSRRIMGRIFDAASGRPVPHVSLQVAGDSAETRTSRHVDVAEDGTFIYDGAGDGRYVLTAAADGYLHNEPLQIQLAENDGDREVELPLLRGTEVQVTVVDRNLKPIAGAAILMDFAPHGAPTRLMRTDDQGTIGVTVAEKSSRTMYVVPPAASLAITRVSARDAESGLRVIVPEGAATLRVQTRSASDEPLAGIAVELRYAGEPIPLAVLAHLARDRQGSAVTNALGELTIPALPSGEYEIGWRPRGARQATGWTSVSLGRGETKVTQTFATPNARR